MRPLRPHRPAWLVALLALSLGVPAPAPATLETPGFRAVSVARAAHPISALAVAPDGRLFAALQAVETSGVGVPGRAEIRVYSSYATNDGAVLELGSTWATVDNLRVTNDEEGLLGIALAPDFAKSKLLYAYVTTAGGAAVRELRVYRENAGGTGEYLGRVKNWLEPPDESGQRYGGGFAFGTDGCVFLGLGDNNAPWNAEVLTGVEPPPVDGQETDELCATVCRSPTEYPRRSKDDGEPNEFGKVLRLAVEGASPAAEGSGAPPTTQPAVFATGLRNPGALATHPLTGLLLGGDRGDSQAELDVLESGSNAGWPCLDGAAPAQVADCLGGLGADDVYANHPSWRRPIVTHDENQPPPVSGIAAYTGLGYPAEFYGDIFYVLEDGNARIYRVDLAPPCFLPSALSVAPLPFHDDDQNDDDFTAFFDADDDGRQDSISARRLTAIVQAPNPLGQQVLYVAGREGGGFDGFGIIFRIEYATAFAPYTGPLGRVEDACFAGTYENPFHRQTCLPAGGPCPGSPDGTSCDDLDPCNGTEACHGGICRHGGSPGPDGTACPGSAQCHEPGVCQAGYCALGASQPDGTPCAAGDPCNGAGICTGGACLPGGSPQGLDAALVVKTGRSLSLSGAIHPATPIAPSTTDVLSVELRGASGALFTGTLPHPATDKRWKRSHAPRLFTYADGKGRMDGLTAVQLRARNGGYKVSVRGKRLDLSSLGEGALSPRLVIGNQCFAASLMCSAEARRTRCR